jgi:DNA-binding NarL/FixJ family response regulator
LGVLGGNGRPVHVEVSVGPTIRAAQAASRNASRACVTISDTQRRTQATVTRSRELRAEIARQRLEREDRLHGPAPALTVTTIAALQAAAARLLALAEAAEARIPVDPAPAPTPPAPPGDLLTRRQIEILSLVADGVGTEDIARRLWLSTATVRNHVARTLRALGAHSRVEAVAKARRLGLL